MRTETGSGRGSTRKKTSGQGGSRRSDRGGKRSGRRGRGQGGILFGRLILIVSVLSLALAGYAVLKDREMQKTLSRLMDGILQDDAAGKQDGMPEGGNGGTEGWELTLVNHWNPLPEDWEVTTVALVNGQSVDERCYPQLQEMMDACRAAGCFPLIQSSYRSHSRQVELFEEEVEQFRRQGYSEEEAREKAGQAVAVPGTSEHELGLALDIVDRDWPELKEEQEDTPAQKWLMENSWRYGFILRYPTDKSAITGIMYEPWHYRYVGKEAAEEIHSQGLCLEEYLEKKNGGS